MPALTVRTQAWASNFRPDILRGDALNPNFAVAARYQRSMEVLIRQMIEESEHLVTQMFNTGAAKEFFAQDHAMDRSISSDARVLTNKLKEKFDKLFAGSAQWMAESFANQSDKASTSAVKSSIRKLTGGLTLSTASLKGPLTDILKASIAENVGLIKSIPQQYLNGVQGAVMRSITGGNGMQTLLPYLAKHKEITFARARMIAYDQTRKAFNDLSVARATNLGLDTAEWLHTGGSNHPRKTHIAMSGKIYKLKEGLYDSAEGRNVKPGELINCRCRFRIVIDLGGKDAS